MACIFLIVYEWFMYDSYKVNFPQYMSFITLRAYTRLE